MAESRTALRSGAVVDTEAATEVLRPFLSRSRKLGVIRPGAVVAAPTDATVREREALVASVLRAGAATARIVPAPLAAAIGAEMDVSLPYAQMIVDVGEGVTDCAILRSGRILQSRAMRVGCCTLREKVRDYFRRDRGMDVTTGEAQAIVAAAGVARTSAGERTLSVEMKEGEGRPRDLEVCDAEIQAAVEPALGDILSTAAVLLREAPHGLGCEVIESGIVLTGGGALLSGMRERLAAQTSINVIVPSSPLDAVVLGLRAMLP